MCSHQGKIRYPAITSEMATLLFRMETAGCYTCYLNMLSPDSEVFFHSQRYWLNAFAVFFLYIIGVLVRYFITFARYGKAFSRRTWQ